MKDLSGGSVVKGSRSDRVQRYEFDREKGFPRRGGRTRQLLEGRRFQETVVFPTLDLGSGH